jgi:peptide deformylase
MARLASRAVFGKHTIVCVPCRKRKILSRGNFALCFLKRQDKVKQANTFLNFGAFFLYYLIMEVLTLENKINSEKDRYLRQKAAPIKDINAEIREIAQKMTEAMHEGKGLGLAGPQVGILKRIFVIHAEGDEVRVFINPSIIWTSQEQANIEEGCLSLPGFYSAVKRPAKIKIQAWNEKGRAFTLEVSGMVSRVIQHEYDHLEGILFIDRINQDKREKYLAKLNKVKK